MKIKMSRILYGLLAAAMGLFCVFTALVLPGLAGTPDISWYDTEYDSFDLSSAEQLAGLAELVNDGNSFAGITIKLLEDIDLKDYLNGSADGWMPIGIDKDYFFAGNFDGNGKKITGLWIDRSAMSEVGLFGRTDGAGIKNLGVEIDGEKIVKGKTYAGGLVGHQFGGGITNCYAAGNVESDGYAGGLVGANGSGGGSIKNCYAACDVTATAAGNFAGGLVGSQDGGSGGITYCYATGSVGITEPNPVARAAGGLVGTRNGSSGNIENCAALNGSVTASGGSSNSAGRVAGQNSGGTLGDNYANSGMLLNGATIVCADKNDLNGADVKKADYQSEDWWHKDAANDFFWKDVWYDETDADSKPWVWDSLNRRPILYWQVSGGDTDEDEGIDIDGGNTDENIDNDRKGRGSFNCGNTGVGVLGILSLLAVSALRGRTR